MFLPISFSSILIRKIIVKMNIIRRNPFLILTILFCTLITITAAQSPYVKQILIANSGKFEFAPPYSDFVTLQSNHPLTGSGTYIHTIGTQSAQDLCKNGTLLYIAAQDSLVAIDPDTHERVAAIADSGLNKLLLYGDKLIISKQYPITIHFVQIRKASDLSLIASIEGIPGDCGGMAVIGDTLYVSVNGGWMGTDGKIAVIETTGWSLTRIINLGPEAIGIMNMYPFNGKIVTVNKSPYSSPDVGSLSVYDPATGMFSNYQLPGNVSIGAGIDGSLLYFGYKYGIGTFNLETLQMQDSSLIADPGSALFRYITSAALDTLNGKIFVNVGDYFSPGYCLVHSSDGDSLTSWATGISSDAILVDYRVAPAGIDTDGLHSAWVITPNPVAESMTLQNKGFNSISRITIMDLTGRVLQVNSVPFGPNSYTIQTGHLPSGILTITATFYDGSRSTQKIIKL